MLKICFHRGVYKGCVEMDFQTTGLPDKQLFRDAFNAGWQRYLAHHKGDEKRAVREYVRGPIAMAKLIFGHGGECRQLATAACLAGPSLFSERPAEKISRRLVEFSREVRSVDDHAAQGINGFASGLSGDVRLFLQASAIMLLEHLALCCAGGASDKAQSYREALDLYSAARGSVDTYSLDTRFEIAAMKVTTMLDDQQHIWAKTQKSVTAALVYA